MYLKKKKKFQQFSPPITLHPSKIPKKFKSSIYGLINIILQNRKKNFFFFIYYLSGEQYTGPANLRA